MIVSYPDLGHGIHHYVDKIIGGYVFIRLDIYCDLPKIQFVQLLEEGNLKTGPADENTGLL